MISSREWAGENWLRAKDLEGGPRREIIAVVKPPPPVSDKVKYPKPSIVCESGAVVSLNQGSVRNLRSMLGDDSDGWVGHQIVCRYASGLVGNVEREWVDVEPVGFVRPDQRRPIAKPAAKTETPLDTPSHDVFGDKADL